MNSPLDAQRRTEGLIALLLFVLTIPAANWLVGHAGMVCVPNGPCLVPVLPGIPGVGPAVMAPSGVLMIGLALVLRDLVQRRLGLVAGLGAIVAGTLISAALAPRSIVVASAAAFAFSEFADLMVYTPLQRRRFVLAVVLSGLVGLIVDSVVFLHLAFGSLDFLAGQVVGKAWMIALAVPCLAWLRRRDERAGLQPA